MILVLTSILLIFTFLLFLPVTIIGALELARHKTDSLAEAQIRIKYLGFIVYKYFFELMFKYPTGKIVAEAKKEIGWQRPVTILWRWRHFFIDHLLWYRRSIVSPPLRILAYYGSSDPAQTGMVCGYLSAFTSFIPPSWVEIVHRPDFIHQTDRLYCESKVKVIPIIFLAISIVVFVKVLPIFIKEFYRRPPTEEAISI